MKVFVVISSFPYEGEEFHSVHATLDSAIARGRLEADGHAGKLVTEGVHHRRGVRWEWDNYRTVEVREVEVLT